MLRIIKKQLKKLIREVMVDEGIITRIAVQDLLSDSKQKQQ